MKTPIIKLALGLFLVGNLTVSCNSCSKKTEANTDEANSEMMSEDPSVSSDDAAAGGSAKSGNQSGTGSASGNSNGSAKTGKNADSKSGYSAPNGTDAENHDGDQYTKHDTTPQATGTSIK